MPTFTETTDIAASTATGTTLTVGQSVQARIGVAGDHDWVRVNVVAGQTYTVDVVGTGTAGHIDPVVQLRTGAGAVIAGQFNDDGGANTNSRLTYTATTSGAIYVDVSAFDPDVTGQYQLLVSNTTRPTFDLAMAGGTLDTGVSWSARGLGASITYGFRATAASYTVNGSNISTFAQVTQQEIAAVQRVVQLWSEVANIQFTRVNPTGYTDSAAILVGNYTDPLDGAGAFAYYPGPTVSTERAGDVWLNTDSVNTTSLSIGSYSFFTILHEFGHALGLSHPGAYNAAPGVSITYANSAQFTQDSQQYSVLSYFDASNTGANFGPGQGYPQTPMLFDIYALQQMYGVNTTTRTGATIYGYNNTAGVSFDASVAASRVFAIWDAGGVDTLDFSGWSGNQTITLVAGDFSNTTGLTQNVSIAFGAVIENAIGGAGNDTLIGNTVDNTLNGGLGIDTLTGGLGNDTYIVDTRTDTITELLNQGIDEVRSTTAVYVLGANLENLTFTDGGNHGAGIGNDLDNVITGGTGSDQLFGRGGNDTFFDGGGALADALFGELGNDIYNVANRGTSTSEGLNQGIDEVRTTFFVYALQANIENLTYTDNLRHGAGVGNALDNVIRGGTGNDELFARGGNDHLYGGTGTANALFGQEGDDTYFADAVGDSVFEYANEGTDTVVTGVSQFVLRNNVENLTYTGTADFTGIGSVDNNVITTGAGIDFINGFGGNDTIISGGGADLLQGGDGADEFRFVGNDGIDRILDFVSGSDRIALSNSAFTHTATIAYVQGAGAVANTTNSTFLYDQTTGRLSYDANGTIAGGLTQLAGLNVNQSLTVNDFTFFG